MNGSSPHRTGRGDGRAASAGTATVNDMVYRSLKSDILSNRLRPGSKLVHQALAESLGVSRTPVRESLERLYQEGLLLRIKNRGYFVAEINAQEVDDLYETRLALELHSLRHILTRGLSAANFAVLDRLHAAYKRTIGTEFTRERTVVDRDFHLALARIAGNEYLSRSLEAIFERLLLKRRVEGYADAGEKPFREHTRLLAAIRANDHEAAIAELTTHILNAKGRLSRHLATLADGTAGHSVAGRDQARRRRDGQAAAG